MSFLSDLWESMGGKEGAAAGAGGLTTAAGLGSLFGPIGTLAGLGVGAYGIYNAAHRGGDGGGDIPGSGELRGVAQGLGPQSASLDAIGGGSDQRIADILRQIQQGRADQQARADQYATGVSEETARLQQEQRARIDPIAQSLVSQYQEFIAPLSTGVLPEGAERALQNARQQATTEIKARYANLGISGSSSEAESIANVENSVTAQRFSIAQDMAKTAQTAIGQALDALGKETSTDVTLLSNKYGSLENFLSQYGLSGTTATGQEISAAGQESSTELGVSSAKLGISSLQQQIYQALMGETISQNKDLQNAIAAFASSLGRVGGGGRTGTITFQ